MIEALWVSFISMISVVIRSVSPALAYYNHMPVRADLVNSCGCRQCRLDRDDRVNGLPYECCYMITCPKCGNKRCPHASDHRNECSESNELGQKDRNGDEL